MTVYSNAVKRATGHVLNMAERTFRGTVDLDEDLDDDEAGDQAGGKAPAPIEQHAARLGNIVQGGQLLVGELVSSHLAQLMGMRQAPMVDNWILQRESGIPKSDVYQRPYRVAADALRAGADKQSAVEAGVRRLHSLASTDLQMAKVRQARIALKAGGRKTYRRVIASDNPCDLCQLAADQTYYTDDLMPIHASCNCDVEPDDDSDSDGTSDSDDDAAHTDDSDESEDDSSHGFVQQDLDDLGLAVDRDGNPLYEPRHGRGGPQIPLTNAQALLLNAMSRGYKRRSAAEKREAKSQGISLDELRQSTKGDGSRTPVEAYNELVKVRHHGEIGPVLTWAHQNFRGPQDLPTPILGRKAALPNARPAEGRRVNAENTPTPTTAGGGGKPPITPPFTGGPRALGSEPDPSDRDAYLAYWMARQNALPIDFQGEHLEPHEVQFVERFLDHGETLDWIPRSETHKPTNDFNWTSKHNLPTELKFVKARYPSIHGRIVDAISRAAKQGVRKENFVIDIGDEPLTDELRTQLARYNVGREKYRLSRLWVMASDEITEIHLQK